MKLPEGAAATDGGAYYQSTGVEKAVALARYTDLMHTWWVGGWVGGWWLQ